MPPRGEAWRGAPRTSACRLTVGSMPDWMHRALRGPGAFVWRWFTGKPLDGVPRTDAGWFTKGHAELDPETAPRPPEALGAEVRADLSPVRSSSARQVSTHASRCRRTNMPGCPRSRMALFQFSDANDVSNVRGRCSPVRSSTTVTRSGIC